MDEQEPHQDYLTPVIVEAKKACEQGAGEQNIGFGSVGTSPRFGRLLRRP